MHRLKKQLIKQPTKGVLITLFLLVVTITYGQTVFFQENAGNPAATTAVNAYTGWQNSAPVTYTGTADVRNTQASTGYTGASGQGNVYFAAVAGTQLTISGINTSGYSSITMTAGHYKSTTTSGNELVIEVSADGVNFTPLSYTRPTGTGTAVWLPISPTGTIPQTPNLRIRFRQTITTTQFRIDDIKLTGIAACATPGTQASNLTASAGAFQSMSVNLTPGNGAGRLIKMNTLNSFTPPADGTTPAANTLYSGSGEQVVYSGSGTTVNITGLDPCRDYYFRAYEYNCSGIDILYNTSASPGNPALLSTGSTATGSITIISEDFEGSTIWPYNLTTVSVGTGGTPGVNVTEVRPLFGHLDSKGLVKSYSVNNSSGALGSAATMNFAAVAIPSGSSNIRLMMKVASLNELGDIIPDGTLGRGNDINEDLIVNIRLNGSGGWSPAFTQKGTSNKLFDYVPQNSVTIPWNANAQYPNATDYQNNFTINIPNGTTQVELQVVATNNRTQEAWCLDDLQLTADLPSFNTLPAIFAITGQSSYCSGGSGVQVGLTDSESGVSYQLYFNGVPAGSPVQGTGSPVSFGYQTGEGTYTVVATNSTYTYCTSDMSSPLTVSINPVPVTGAIWHN